MTVSSFSIVKFDERAVNEDAVRADDNLLAVSDGAGGGGMFADQWSQCLIANLPLQPITTVDDLDKYVDTICDTFYQQHESQAKALGPMALQKFYDEGSFATLAAAWRTAPHTWQWMAYGDSVVFCYNRRTKQLQHSFTVLTDFARPPYLINCIDALTPQGFRSGRFDTDSDSVLLVASDALAHYIMLMYQVAHRSDYETLLRQAADAATRNATFVRMALSFTAVDFDQVLSDLLTDSLRAQNLLHQLADQWLIGPDDYSLAFCLPDEAFAIDDKTPHDQ